MKIFTPDFLTAFGMTAMSAFTVSWVMWTLGKQYWHQGMSFAVFSTLCYGFVYVSFTLQYIFGLLTLQVITKLLISLAMGTFTLALQQFKQSSHPTRDSLTIGLPLGLSILLVFWCLPADIAKFNMLHTVITIFQTLYTIYILLQMRTRTPGIGWRVVTAAAFMQLAAIIPMLFAKQRPTPDFATEASTGNILAMWVVCFMVFFKMVVTSIGFLVMLRDRQLVLEKDQAKLDYLTQLPNRAALVENLERITHEHINNNTPLTVMIIDIDHFKKVNDQYGHLAGDQVIKSVSQKIKELCRSTDLAARYGGEEFVLLLPITTQENALVLAERLCTSIRKMDIILPNEQQLRITISLGVHCCIPSNNTPWEKLIEAADIALYKAKNSGRDRVVFSSC